MTVTRSWLSLLVLAACGQGSSTTVDAGISFGDASIGPPATDASRDAKHPRDATLDGSGTGPLHDANVGDALYYAGCDAPCVMGCAGTCSAGHCLETAVSHVVLVNNAILVDPRALYWRGLAPDSGPAGYTVWRDALDAGQPTLLASSVAYPDAGFMVQGPVVGGLGGAFFATVGPTASGPGRVFGAWPGVGERLLYAPDSAFFGGLAVDEASVYASVSPGTSSIGVVLRIPVDGGEPVSLYSEPIPAGSAAGNLAVHGASFAWLVGSGGQFTIFTGALDGGAALLPVTQLTDAGSPALQLDDTYVYWVAGEGQTNSMNAKHTVYRVPIAGGAPEAFLEDDDIESFTLDDTYFYWSTAHPTGTPTSPYVYSQARTPTATVGVRPTLLACEEAGGIAVDNAFVYLGGATTVYRLAK